MPVLVLPGYTLVIGILSQFSRVIAVLVAVEHGTSGTGNSKASLDTNCSMNMVLMPTPDKELVSLNANLIAALTAADLQPRSTTKSSAAFKPTLPFAKAQYRCNAKRHNNAPASPTMSPNKQVSACHKF